MSESLIFYSADSFKSFMYRSKAQVWLYLANFVEAKSTLANGNIV